MPNTFKLPGESDDAWLDRITGATPAEQTQQSQASEPRCCLSCLTPSRCNEYMEGGWTCPDVLNDQEQQPAAQEVGLTESERVKCLVDSGCIGTVKMTYDSGPYEITRTSINSDRLIDSVIAALRAKPAQEVGLTDEERADMACAVAAICTGTSSRTVAATAIEWTERALRAKGGK